MFKGLGDCLTQSSIILKYKLQIKCLIAYWFKTWAFKGRISFAYFPSLDITRPALKAQVNNHSLAPSQVLPWASSHVSFPVPSRSPFRAPSYMPFQCRPVHRPALRPILRPCRAVSAVAPGGDFLQGLRANDVFGLGYRNRSQVLFPRLPQNSSAVPLAAHDRPAISDLAVTRPV